MIKRLPWLRRLKKTDPEPPLRLPVACGAVSNGEGWWPDTSRKRLIRKLVHEKAEEVSRREGIDRREFMASACGMATTLYMINLVNGCASSREAPGNGGGPGTDPPAPSSSGAGMDAGARDAASGGRGGGGFAGVPPEAMVDADVAGCLTESRGELIIDMQTHYVDYNSNPFTNDPLILGPVPAITPERYPWLTRVPGCEGTTCFERAAYVDQIFLGSDTTIAVVSGIPYTIGNSGEGSDYIAALTNEAAMTGNPWLELQFPQRVLSHCMVMPNDRIDLQLAMMERFAATTHNWKTYTPWSPGTIGYYLDDELGVRMIQKGLDLGVPIFCAHKGLPLVSFDPAHTSPRDIGPVANMFPDAYFVVFHSAFEQGLQPGESSFDAANDPDADAGWGAGAGIWPEGPYNEQDPAVQALYPLDRGVNSLIKSLRDNNIGPNGTRLDGSSGPTTHVYAECGAVWANLMLRPEEAMHYFGKLLKHVGEDRILWGTDCLWFGSPQPLIQAFRVFEISQEFQDLYEYPALTSYRKAKILGQNAARLQSLRTGVNIPPESCHGDFVGSAAVKLKRELDEEFGPRRDMIANVSGPRTRREFLRLAAREHQEKLAWSARLRSKV